MNISVVVLPAKVLANGKHKVRIAISHNCETRYKVTRFLVNSPKNIKNGRVVGKDIPDAEYINIQLNAMVQKMYKAFDTIDNAECYTCSQLLQLIEGNISKSNVVTVKQIADEWLSVVKEKNANRTYDLYKLQISQFIDFVGEEFVLSLISPSLIKKYETFLKTRDAYTKRNEKKKLSLTSIKMRMDCVMFFINFATSHKYISLEVDPFIDCDRYDKIIRDLSIPVSLLRKIRDAQLVKYQDILARDLFMLSFYLCGINYTDMMKIDFRQDVLSFSRTKNSKLKKNKDNTEFTIQPEARAIINKYIDKDGKLKFGGRKTVTQISSFFDYHLKRIRDILGTDQRLVYYCARKTFTQLSYVLGIQERTIKYCIGDSLRNNDILMFYTKTNKQMADEAIRKVFDFVASNKTEDDLYQSSKES